MAKRAKQRFECLEDAHAAEWRFFAGLECVSEDSREQEDV